MREVLASRNAAPPAVHRVLAIRGSAPAQRLLDLARCSTPRGARMELFTLIGLKREIGA